MSLIVDPFPVTSRWFSYSSVAGKYEYEVFDSLHLPQRPSRGARFLQIVLAHCGTTKDFFMMLGLQHLHGQEEGGGFPSEWFQEPLQHLHGQEEGGFPSLSGFRNLYSISKARRREVSQVSGFRSLYSISTARRRGRFPKFEWFQEPLQHLHGQEEGEVSQV
ncbi:hypothetical protein BgiMline_014228 [Biomphalaria glabrata]|nr:hypothetical protein BgiMline_013009 [Biomphalaria glabrata]